MRNTFKKDYEQAKTKYTKIKELAIKGLKLLNFFRGYSYNFKQNKRDFCPYT